MQFAEHASLTGEPQVHHAQVQRPTGQNVGTTERVISVVGGAGLIAQGIRSRGLLGLMMALVGGELIRRGATGHCMLYDQIGVDTTERHRGKPEDFFRRGIHVEESVTIQRPKDDIYNFWRNFENLPRFMNHLRRVEVVDEKVSRWIANAPAGYTVEWTAEIINEEPGSLIAWRSLLGADVDNRGSVRFREAAGGAQGRGTEVKVTLEYIPPAGRIGSAIARLFGENPEQQIRDDLHRLREILETGEIATIQGQPSGRGSEYMATGAARPAGVSAHEAGHASHRVSEKPGFSGVNAPKRPGGADVQHDEPSARPGREAQP